MTTLLHALRRARRGFTLILGLATLGFLAYGSQVPAVEAADSTRRANGMPTSRLTAAPTRGRSTSSATGSVAFPVVTSVDRRYLQDQNGQPFPILGRASWAVVSLSEADYRSYLDDTANKGFNAIELMAIYRLDRCNNRPFAGNGEAPFTKDLSGASWTGSMVVDPDFTTPNEAYWSHVDGLLLYALTKGILCFVFPAYYGHNGDFSEGWAEMISNNGASKMTTYGAWIANRYKLYPNIVWMLGGDSGTNPVFGVGGLAAERAMLSGMQSVSGQASTNFSAEWSGDSIYTDQPDATLRAAGTLQGAYSSSVSTWCRNGYAATPAMPAFLLEGPYDEEGPDGTNANANATQPVRRFQWWSWLSGIGGYILGNGYVWTFNSGVWSAHLNTQTTQDMARLNAFMKSIEWYTLVPSGLGGMGTIVTAGGSTPSATDYVAAAANPAGTLLVAYVPPDHTGNITVDMTTMSGSAQARWYNPTTAAHTLISPSIANTGTHTFSPPADNGSGYSDWVLLLDVPTPTPTLTPTPTRTPTPTQTPTQTPTLTPTPNTTPGSTTFFALTPCRLIDTRRPTGPLGGPAVDAAIPRTFAIANVCNVPSTARAISFNVTVVGAATAGDYRLHAADIPPPIASTLNFGANQTRANNGVLALSGDGLGRFTVQPDFPSGTSHLVVDVNGYFQ